jgi:hypothetical protein
MNQTTHAVAVRNAQPETAQKYGWSPVWLRVWVVRFSYVTQSMLKWPHAVAAAVPAKDGKRDKHAINVEKEFQIFCDLLLNQKDARC